MASNQEIKSLLNTHSEWEAEEVYDHLVHSWTVKEEKVLGPLLLDKIVAVCKEMGR